MASTDELIADLIALGGETRNVDYKAAMPWPKTKDEQARIVRDILAMANTEDGGRLLIGMDDASKQPIGLTPQVAATWDTTIVGAVTANYGSPPPHLEVLRGKNASLEFAVIRVHEFDQIPIVCKAPHVIIRPGKKREVVLRQAGLYIRSAAAESIEIADESRMRSLLDRAFARRRHELIAEIRELVGPPTAPEVPAESVYADEIAKDLESFGEL